MKRSEIITKYYDDIAAALVEHYRYVIEAEGRIQYKVYIWEDGELEYLYGPQGDNGWLKPREMEPRALYYVHTISESPSFSLWDCADHAAPDDEEEREAERVELIDYLVQEYESNIGDLLDAIIDEAENEERYDD